MTRRILIATDLDGTLIPNGRAPESPSARERFARLAGRSEVTLAYVTGRHKALVEEAIEEFSLPLPRWVIGDVGTTIYGVNRNGWQPWSSWKRRLVRQWRPGTASELLRLTREIAGLRPQDESKQAEFKVSFYLEDGIDWRDTLAGVRSRFAGLETPTRLILSLDSEGVGLLDVLPPAAGKLSALEFVLGQEGLQPESSVFSGDSGNDLEVLTSRLPSVLVANAGAEVATEAQKMAAAAGDLEALYIARGGLLGMNGNYAAGILEGIVHFQPDTLEWLR